MNFIYSIVIAVACFLSAPCAAQPYFIYDHEDTALRVINRWASKEGLKVNWAIDDFKIGRNVGVVYADSFEYACVKLFESSGRALYIRTGSGLQPGVTFINTTNYAQ